MKNDKENDSKKDVEGETKPEITRREFVEKGAVALVLLPYVTPVIQSLTVTSAWAKRMGSRPGSPHSPGSPGSPKRPKRPKSPKSPKKPKSPPS